MGANFVKSQFDNDANFNGSRFEHADFRGSQFNKWAEFLASWVKGNADFGRRILKKRNQTLATQWMDNPTRAKR
jgi:uncharacterized protein YjbI with pentapeptide repeats